MDNVLCLCNHPEPLHLLTGRCSVLGCTCTLFEWDPIGGPTVWGMDFAKSQDWSAQQPTPHSQHRTPVPGCDLCDSLMDEARALESEEPWRD